MEIEEEDYNSYNHKQIQVQDKSQLLRKKQDQVSCNNCLGMLLSSMESLFIKNGYNISIKFDHYNYFNNRNWKTKEQIKSQLYIDLMGYKLSKMAYIQKYGTFDNPDYPPIDEIKNIILNWKEIAKEPEEIKLCDEICDLISDNNQKSLSYYQTRIEKSSKTSKKANPNTMFKLSNNLHGKFDERNKNIEEKLNKNIRSKFGLQMGEEESSKNELSKSMNLSLNLEIEVEANNELKKKKKKKIIEKMKDLLNLSKQLYEGKIEAKDVEESLENVEKIIKDYDIDNNDINFLYEHFHKDKTIDEMEKYSSKFSKIKEKKNIFEHIKKLFNNLEYH